MSGLVDSEAAPIYQIWGLECPFTKSGFPVMGQFGRTSKMVVVMTTETWKQLCIDHPTLGTAQFNVGVLEPE